MTSPTREQLLAKRRAEAKAIPQRREDLLALGREAGFASEFTTVDGARVVAFDPARSIYALPTEAAFVLFRRDDATVPFETAQLAISARGTDAGEGLLAYSLRDALAYVIASDLPSARRAKLLVDRLVSAKRTELVAPGDSFGIARLDFTDPG